MKRHSKRCQKDSNKQFQSRYTNKRIKKQSKYNLKTRVRMTNRCVLNNRSRGVFRPYGISRVLMRDLMQFGILPGYAKAVW